MNIPQPTTPSILVDCNCSNAENPLWHPYHKCLYWSDIPEGKLFRYGIGQEKYEQVHSGEPIGGFTIQADGSLLLFRTRGAVEIWKDEEIVTVIHEIPEARTTRFNDVIADPKGRVFAGTMATDNVKGQLYRIELDGSYQSIVKDLVIPNGMAFSADSKTFYMTDSYMRSIYKFDYDLDSGELSNQKLHIEVPKGEGVPDGMTIDSESYLWSARWDGSALYRYDPDGKEILKVTIPVERVSSVTFGGEDYKQIFISSAKGERKSQLKNTSVASVAGNIFCMKSAVAGKPEFFSRVLL